MYWCISLQNLVCARFSQLSSVPQEACRPPQEAYRPPQEAFRPPGSPARSPVAESSRSPSRAADDEEGGGNRSVAAMLRARLKVRLPHRCFVVCGFCSCVCCVWFLFVCVFCVVFVRVCVVCVFVVLLHAVLYMLSFVSPPYHVSPSLPCVTPRPMISGPHPPLQGKAAAQPSEPKGKDVVALPLLDREGKPLPGAFGRDTTAAAAGVCVCVHSMSLFRFSWCVCERLHIQCVLYGLMLGMFCSVGSCVAVVFNTLKPCWLTASTYNPQCPFLPNITEGTPANTGHGRGLKDDGHVDLSTIHKRQRYEGVHDLDAALADNIMRKRRFKCAV